GGVVGSRTVAILGAGERRAVPRAEVSELDQVGHTAAAIGDYRVAVADVRAERGALVEVGCEERSRRDEVRRVREHGVELRVVVVDDVDALRGEEEQTAAHLARVPGARQAGLELRVVENDLYARKRFGRGDAHDHETLVGRRPAGRSGGLAAGVAAGTAVALLGIAHDAVAAGLRQRAVAVAAVAVGGVPVVALLARTLDAIPAGGVGNRRGGGDRRRGGGRGGRTRTGAGGRLLLPLRLRDRVRVGRSGEVDAVVVARPDSQHDLGRGRRRAGQAQRQRRSGGLDLLPERQRGGLGGGA